MVMSDSLISIIMRNELYYHIEIQRAGATEMHNELK